MYNTKMGAVVQSEARDPLSETPPPATVRDMARPAPPPLRRGGGGGGLPHSERERESGSQRSLLLLLLLPPLLLVVCRAELSAAQRDQPLLATAAGGAGLLTVFPTLDPTPT